MQHVAGVVLCSLLATTRAGAQVLITGETGGAGGHAVMATANLLAPDDFDTLANFWGQYGYGLSSRVDVLVAYGNISVFGDTQHYVGAGSNIGLLKRGRQIVDVSFFNTVSVPMTRRDQASTVFVTLALVASRPMTLGSFAITPYGGFNTLMPIGERKCGIFTPVETLHTGIAGVTVPFGRAWSAYVEYSPGPGIRCGGFGILYVRPKQP